MLCARQFGRRAGATAVGPCLTGLAGPASPSREAYNRMLHNSPTSEKKAGAKAPTSKTADAAEAAPKASRTVPTSTRLIAPLIKLLGYDKSTSQAIRMSSLYYDDCARRGIAEAEFFYEECLLPPSFQTWFSITTLHAWLVNVRLRSLPAPSGKLFIQEFVNHVFLDVEHRLRGPYGVTRERLIKKYLKHLYEQFRGQLEGYDECLALQGSPNADAVLAMCLWRNLFGCGWGAASGIRGKKAPRSGDAPDSKTGFDGHPVELILDPVQSSLLKKDAQYGEVFKSDEPILDASTSVISTLTKEEHDQRMAEIDLAFAPLLERLVLFIRKDLKRLEAIPDSAILTARYPTRTGSLVDFTKI